VRPDQSQPPPQGTTDELKLIPHGTHRSVSDILHRMAGARGEDECRAGISGGARGRDFAICVRNAAGANPGEEDG